jgi:hypothetical protein
MMNGMSLLGYRVTNGTITYHSALLPAPAVLAHRRGRQALAQQAGLMNQG